MPSPWGIFSKRAGMPNLRYQVLPWIASGIALNKSLVKYGQAVAQGDATVRELGGVA